MCASEWLVTTLVTAEAAGGSDDVDIVALDFSICLSLFVRLLGLSGGFNGGGGVPSGSAPSFPIESELGLLKTILQLGYWSFARSGETV